jgi:hypothetical protein
MSLPKIGFPIRLGRTRTLGQASKKRLERKGKSHLALAHCLFQSKGFDFEEEGTMESLPWNDGDYHQRSLKYF